MDKYTYPLPDPTYKTLAKKLYSPLVYGENSVLVCPPLYGRDHNVNFLWERVADREEVLGIQAQRFTFAQLQLVHPEAKVERIWISQMEQAAAISEGKLSGFDDFRRKLKAYLREGRELAFFVNIPETLTDSQFVRFLELAQKTYYIAPARIHFLLIFDMKWNEADFFTLSAPFRSLFQNVVFLAQYQDREVLHLLKHFCYKWNYQPSRQILAFITEQAGGILLLAKAGLRIAVREKLKTLAETERRLPSSPDLLLQMKFFLSVLTPLQQKILSQLARRLPVDDERELTHLVQMGLVRPTAAGLSIRSQALMRLLAGRQKTKEQLMAAVTAGEFSQREKKLLTFILERPGSIVSRDEIADILWGEKKYDKYSDWALDQTISRLRKKLTQEADLSHLTLVSHKRKGFSVEL